MGAHRLGRVDHILVGGIVVAVADVVLHVAGEQVRLLQHHAHLRDQGLSLHVPQVVAVDGDASFGHIGKPVNQGNQGALAGAGGTHQSHVLAGADVQVHVLQYFHALDVVEINVLEPDFAPDGGHLNGVGFVLYLRLQVHQLEDADAGSHGALENAVLHGQVANGLEEALDPDGEGQQYAPFQVAVLGQQAAH